MSVCGFLTTVTPNLLWTMYNFSHSFSKLSWSHCYLLQPLVALCFLFLCLNLISLSRVKMAQSFSKSVTPLASQTLICLFYALMKLYSVWVLYFPHFFNRANAKPKTDRNAWIQRDGRSDGVFSNVGGVGGGCAFAAARSPAGCSASAVTVQGAFKWGCKLMKNKEAYCELPFQVIFSLTC